MLVRICLRQEGQLSIRKQDTAFALFLRRRPRRWRWSSCSAPSSSAVSYKQSSTGWTYLSSPSRWNSEENESPQAGQGHVGGGEDQRRAAPVTAMAGFSVDGAQGFCGQERDKRKSGRGPALFLEISNRSLQAQNAYLVLKRLCHSGGDALYRGQLAAREVGEISLGTEPGEGLGEAVQDLRLLNSRNH